MKIDSAAAGELQMWRDAAIGSMGVDLVASQRISHCFTHHCHAEYLLAVLESGAKQMRIGHRQHVAVRHSIAFIPAGQAYIGEPVGSDGSWSHRAFFPDRETIREMADAALTGTVRAGSEFDTDYVFDDAQLASQLIDLHRIIEQGEGEIIRRQEAFGEIMEALFKRHARPMLGRRTPQPRRSAIGRAVDCMHARFNEADLSVEDLADAAGMSKYHFMRNFRATLGITSHAYLVKVRVRAARDLLQAGEPACNVATMCGFFDQSHLIRHFRQVHGVTPGNYLSTTRKLVPR